MLIGHLGPSFPGHDIENFSWDLPQSQESTVDYDHRISLLSDCIIPSGVLVLNIPLRRKGSGPPLFMRTSWSKYTHQGQRKTFSMLS